MSLRDELRAVTVGKCVPFKREVVTIDGKDIYVRQPSVGERSRIDKAARVNDTFDWARYQAFCVIALTEDEGGVKVFEDADYDALIAAPAGSWFDQLFEAVQRATNTTENERKNSEAIQAD